LVIVKALCFAVSADHSRRIVDNSSQEVQEHRQEDDPCTHVPVFTDSSDDCSDQHDTREQAQRKQPQQKQQQREFDPTTRSHVHRKRRRITFIGSGESPERSDDNASQKEGNQLDTARTPDQPEQKQRQARQLDSTARSRITHKRRITSDDSSESAERDAGATRSRCCLTAMHKQDGVCRLDATTTQEQGQRKRQQRKFSRVPESVERDDTDSTNSRHSDDDDGSYNEESDDGSYDEESDG